MICSLLLNLLHRLQLIIAIQVVLILCNCHQLTLEEFEEAVKDAETIYHFVRSRLPEEVHP